MFRDRAMFPILSQQGKVLGFGGRAMGDNNPKYLNTPDSPVFNKRLGLYAMNFVRKERGLKRLVLVEGYMDVVSLRRAGVPVLNRWSGTPSSLSASESVSDRNSPAGPLFREKSPIKIRLFM